MLKIYDNLLLILQAIDMYIVIRVNWDFSCEVEMCPALCYALGHNDTLSVESRESNG